LITKTHYNKGDDFLIFKKIAASLLAISLLFAACGCAEQSELPGESVEETSLTQAEMTTISETETSIAISASKTADTTSTAETTSLPEYPIRPITENELQRYFGAFISKFDFQNLAYSWGLLDFNNDDIPEILCITKDGGQGNASCYVYDLYDEDYEPLITFKMFAREGLSGFAYDKDKNIIIYNDYVHSYFIKEIKFSRIKTENAWSIDTYFSARIDSDSYDIPFNCFELNINREETDPKMFEEEYEKYINQLDFSVPYILNDELLGYDKLYDPGLEHNSLYENYLRIISES
jgi:hypothetical protein